MKNTIKIFAVAVILFIMATMTIPVLAEEKEQKELYLKSSDDIVFWIRWDVEIPSIYFISPDGNKWDPMQSSANTSTVTDTNSLYYIIMDAQAGQWVAHYDKANNSYVKISVMEYGADLEIDCFLMGEMNNNIIPVEFTVSGDEGIAYNYEISATTSQEDPVVMLLASGTGSTGQTIKTDVDLGPLQSHVAYVLKLQVWYNDEGADHFVTTYSDPFECKNNNNNSTNPDFHITIMPEQQQIRISWEELEAQIEEINISILSNDNITPLFSYIYPASQNSIQIPYNHTQNQITVSVVGKANNTDIKLMHKTITFSEYALHMPDENIINSLIWPVKYHIPAGQKITINLNGTESSVITDNSGTINIELKNGWNQIILSYCDNSGITWQTERHVFTGEDTSSASNTAIPVRYGTIILLCLMGILLVTCILLFNRKKAQK